MMGSGFGENSVQANTDAGILYGVYELLRRQQTGEPINNDVDNPSYDVRILNHWDNLNGTVERGYAGNSIFWRKENPFTVTEIDKTLWKQYARANASIGINASVLDKCECFATNFKRRLSESCKRNCQCVEALLH